ncbi:MAG: ABC transporter permease [Rhodopila sp.]|jgi:taurine transport system permease protein
MTFRHIPIAGRNALIGLAAVIAATLLWQVVADAGVVSQDFLPPPTQIWQTFCTLLRDGYRETTLAGDIAATLGRCLAGFLLALLTGIPLGLAMGLSRRASAATGYIVQFMRPLPPLSYLILLILWLGTGDSSKIALPYLTAFPIIASAAMAGVRGVKQQRIQAARTLGASGLQILCHVIFPASLPTIFTGLRIALAAAFSTVVAAELMAASNGIGWMIFSASQFLRTDIVVLGILILGLLGMLLNALLVALDHHIVHWRGVE